MTSCYKKTFVLFACVLSACTQLENIETECIPNAKIFYANLPASNKTYLDGDWNVYWRNGDNFSVFQSATNEKYKFAGTAGEITNKFIKADETVMGKAYDNNYAVYPYLESTNCAAEGIIGLELPSIQFYSPDSFGQDSNTMIAVTKDSADDVFFFKNLCGYLRLKIYGGDTIRKITLRGNNGEKIAGDATITAAFDSAPLLVMGDSATTEITLDCEEGGVETVDDPDQYTTFWFVIPPTIFSEGITLDITTINGVTRSHTTKNRISIQQNRVSQMAAFEWGTQTSPKINTFSITDGVKTFKSFNISNGYVNIMVPNQYSLKEMTASFIFKGVSVRVNGVEQSSGVNSHDFSAFANPVEYEVTSADGSSKTYKIRIFDLPVLIIDIPYNVSPYRNVWTTGATIKLWQTDNSSIDYGTVSIKVRGNFTAGYPKKPYNLKFDSKKSFFELPKHKRWCLMANWIDKTQIRNMVAFEIARLCEGLDWTPDGQYVELILNGEHKGNYYLCEAIRTGTGRVDISKENGYLMTLDNTWDEKYKFKSEIKQYPYMFKDPDEVTEEQFNSVRTSVNEMEASLYDDSKFAAREYLNYLDEDSAIDYWFVYEITGCNEPYGPRSVYMYKDGDGPWFSGPVWDFDLGTFIPSRITGWHNKSYLYYARLFQDQDFKNRVFERWNMYMKDSGKIPVFIDKKADEIRSSESRDVTIWPYDYTSNGEQDLTFDQAVERMRQCYLSRIAWMDTQIKAMVKFDSTDGANEDFDGQNDGKDDFGFAQ